MSEPAQQLESPAVPDQADELPHVGGFDALEPELDYAVPAADVRGSIPASVTGTLFRIGPGRNRLGDQVFGHWFDGDGMLHRLTFAGGGLHYRARYVRTPKYVEETRAGRILFRSFGHNAPGGMLRNLGRLPANAANTSLVWHGGRLLALWEGGRPWRLDPETLDTVGEFDFDGDLGRFDAFSAHGKIDPRSGYYYNHGLGFGLRGPRLSIYRMDPSGRMVARRNIPVPMAAFIHDFAFAGDYLVYLLHPVGVTNPLSFISGRRAFNDCVGYYPERGMEALVVEAATLRPVRRIPLDPFVVFHFGNAWQEGRQLVVDLMKFDDFTINDALSDVFHARSQGGARPVRLLLDLEAGSAERHDLPLAAEGEFPRWDQRFSGRPTRWLYGCALLDNGTGTFFNGVQRIDTRDGRVEVHDFGPRRFTSEAVFVPEGEGEGDGYLAAVVYDARAGRSEVVLLDARSPGLPEVAAVPLRHHVPFGFHGEYVPESFLSGQAQ